MKRQVPSLFRKKTIVAVMGLLPLLMFAVREAGADVKVTETGDKVKVEINGKLFTEYNYKEVQRPFFYPLIGPTDCNVTRNFPMKEVPDEERDHPHHKSLWFTHGDVSGTNFWADSTGKVIHGKVVHDKFLEISSGKDVGVIKSQNNWVAPDGKIVCSDTRTHRFYNRAGCCVMDFEITIHASNGEIVFRDTKEGSMAIRMAPTMAVKGKVAKGHIVNSLGDCDAAAWGKKAEWCDYYGPLEGQVVGVAMFDHPSNPRHPTWWHVRDYGLFAANPFGQHDFEKKPAGTGNLKIAAGENVTFRYRIYIHKGDEKAGQVDAQYREYVKEIK
jgi:hypothetical protein